MALKKLCYVATVPAVVHAFLRPHIQAAAMSYEVTVVCNADDQYLLEGLSATIILLPIVRKPSPWRDLLTLYQLWKLFRVERFDIVHSIMPKMGLLAMLAAWAADIPIRLHTFTGQVWVTKTGLSRKVFMLFDRLIAKLATCVLTDSPSQRDFLMAEGVLHSGEGEVIGAGSICGVDPVRFRADADIRLALRLELGIPLHAIVILFMGRLNREKGMLELAAAFKTLALSDPNLYLLLVGTEEDVQFEEIQQICSSSAARLFHQRFTPAPERFMAAADIFCLPSYREGFGLTVIEAASCGVPCVASRIYGVTDAVVDGVTGLLVDVKNSAVLAEALRLLVDQPALRQRLGSSARERVQTYFSQQVLVTALMDFYQQQLFARLGHSR